MDTEPAIHHILTHPGGAHKDDFLACCLLIHVHGVPVVRREPTAHDLADPGTCVVDVGDEHAPERRNFDHHQFPREHPPACALSLVLQELGVYADARLFCDWLETSEWLDSRGPVSTARWLGVERDVLSKLNSPVDITLLRRFSLKDSLGPGDAIWQVMAMVGEDLLSYLQSLRERLDFIEAHAEWWTIDTSSNASFEVVFLPRTKPLPEEPSMGISRYVESQGKGESVIAMVYPDRRGEGYGLSRFNDNEAMDFTKITDCEDVHFAHARGFVAKTSATQQQRLRELLATAHVIQ